MNLDFRNLPTGNLPYNDIQLCKQMMLRLYEKIPFLPELPLLDSNDTLFNRTFSNIPSIMVKDGKIILPDINDNQFTLAMLHLDSAYESDNVSYLDKYGTETPYFNLYVEIIKKIKPNYTIINLMGAFTFANSVFNRNASSLLTDRMYRRFIVEAITIKALWFINKIKEAYPSIKPIIIFEENFLYKFGTLKRTNDSITKETVTTILSKIFQRVKKAGGYVCVQSFEKCNWQLIFESGNVDMVSFDAYNNPSNLSIIAGDVSRFLQKGGYINWGIVPVMNENAIRSLNIDKLYDKFTSTLEDLASCGVSMDLLYKNSTISVQGNLSKYPILFAEKALIMANQLSKKIPFTSAK